MIIDDDDYQDGRLLYDLIHFTDNSEGVNIFQPPCILKEESGTAKDRPVKHPGKYKLRCSGSGLRSGMVNWNTRRWQTRNVDRWIRRDSGSGMCPRGPRRLRCWDTARRSSRWCLSRSGGLSAFRGQFWIPSIACAVWSRACLFRYLLRSPRLADSG